jgi:hypothetical protein
MHLRTGKSIGSQNIAKGGANFVGKTGTLAHNATFTTDSLETPGLPKLTFIAIQTLGNGSAEFRPQIALRRELQGDLVFIDLAPTALLNAGGDPTVFEFNVPVQAIRAVVTNTTGANVAVTVVLAASG